MGQGDQVRGHQAGVMPTPFHNCRSANDQLRGDIMMKLPRRTISASGRGRCRAAGRLAYRVGASLSVAAGALGRRLCRRRRDRHPRAPDRSMAVGAARPAIRHREPAGRGGNIGTEAVVRAPPTATRSSWSAAANAINATLYDKLNFNFIRDIAPVAGIMPRSLRHGGQSVGSSQDDPRVHRLCQEPIPASSTWRRPASAAGPHLAGELFKMMAGVDMVHVPYRSAGAGTDRLDRWAGAGHVPRHCQRRSNTSGPASCARWR